MIRNLPKIFLRSFENVAPGLMMHREECHSLTESLEAGDLYLML